MIILLTARYSKYINVDANSAHQRFCELCSKHTARNAVFFAKPCKPTVTAVTDLARFKQTHQLLSITVGPPGQQTMGSICWWISEPYVINKKRKMKDGGTGRRGEMNLSLQKASETGLRGAAELREGRTERRWGSLRASAAPANANEPICSTSCGRRVKKREGLSGGDGTHTNGYLMTRFIQMPPGSS